jgi:hypothetical protein
MGKKISQLTEQTTIADANAFVLEDTTANLTKKTLWSTIKSTLKTYFDTLYASISVDGNPVGTIIALDLSMPSTPTISTNYEECNGQLISDGDSVYNGYRLRNLNGADVVLTLTWTADVGGAYATVAATDVTALAEGDDVSGGAIAAGSTITDITGTTVTISDVDIDTEVESTFTNRGRFLRGKATSGTGGNDAMQRITGSTTTDSASGIIRDSAIVSGVFSVGSEYDNDRTGSTANGFSLEFDSADSTSPNTAKTDDTETRPIYLDVVYYQKIK